MIRRRTGEIILRIVIVLFRQIHFGLSIRSALLIQ